MALPAEGICVGANLLIKLQLAFGNIWNDGLGHVQISKVLSINEVSF